MPKFLSQVDLSKIPVLGLVPETNATAPASPNPGQLWYDTSQNRLKTFENGAWIWVNSDTTYPQGIASDITAASPSNSVLNVFTPLAIRTAIDTRIAAGVTSVAGRVGAVVLTKSDVGLGSVDNTADSAKPISSAQQTALNLKAPLADPVFTGNPTAPTPTAGDNDTSIATTAFVTTAVAPKANSASPTFTGTVTVPLNPTNATDAASKGYVDGAIQGLDAKASVRAASAYLVGNLTLSGLQTVDGVSLAAGNRVLVAYQTNGAQNGIYVVSSGAWTRATDMDTWAEVPGAFVFVEEGTNYGDTGWISAANQSGTLGTTAIDWLQFSSAGTVTASGGLQKIGNDISLAVGGVGTLALQDGAVGASNIKDGAISLVGSKISGALPINSGGTGATTVPLARNGLLAIRHLQGNVPALSPGTWVSLGTFTADFGLGGANSAQIVRFFDNTTKETVNLDYRRSESNGQIEIKADVAVADAAFGWLVHTPSNW